MTRHRAVGIWHLARSTSIQGHSSRGKAAIEFSIYFLSQIQYKCPCACRPDSESLNEQTDDRLCFGSLRALAPSTELPVGQQQRHTGASERGGVILGFVGQIFSLVNDSLSFHSGGCVCDAATGDDLASGSSACQQARTQTTSNKTAHPLLSPPHRTGSVLPVKSLYMYSMSEEQTQRRTRRERAEVERAWRALSPPAQIRLPAPRRGMIHSGAPAS